jgi:hypothetical protein
MPEMTPEQMRARIAELEGELSFVYKLTRLSPEMIAPLTAEEIHDMLHGPRAPEGSIEKMIKEMQADLDIKS